MKFTHRENKKIIFRLALDDPPIIELPLPLQNIENATHSQNRAEFHALFVPNRSLLCDKRLQDLGVYGSFTFIDELGTFWFPLEADLISMEAPRDTQFDRRNYILSLPKCRAFGLATPLSSYSFECNPFPYSADIL